MHERTRDHGDPDRVRDYFHFSAPASVARTNLKSAFVLRPAALTFKELLREKKVAWFNERLIEVVCADAFIYPNRFFSRVAST